MKDTSPKPFLNLQFSCKLSTFALLTLIFIASSCKKENPFDNDNLVKHIRISKWLNGAKSAVTFTFDDNDTTHYTIGRILENYSFRGSFFVNPGLETWNFPTYRDRYSYLIMQGHEIGNHTLNHDWLVTRPLEVLSRQIVEPIEIIQTDLGVKPLSFVHPYNSKNNLVDHVVFSTHLFSRVSSTYSLDNRIYANIVSSTTLNKMKKFIDDSNNSGKWLIIAGHGFKGSGWEPITEEFLIETCEYIFGSGKQIWVGTLQEVAAYEYLKEELKISYELFDNELIISTKGFDNEKYIDMQSLPFTIEIKLNKGYIPLNDGDYFSISYNQNKNNYYLTFNAKQLKTLNIQIEY